MTTAPPPWIVMLAIACAMFAACKWWTWQTTTVHGAPAWRHAAYLVAWPGLNADRFLSARGAAASPCAVREWLWACGRVVTGAAVTFGLMRTLMPTYEYPAALIGTLGLVLAFHFGWLHLLSCFWRGAGVRADPVMNRPWVAASLGDFWGRRWNTAFRDFTHQFVFRPLASRFGAHAALLGGFLFSGLIHDLVISVPARGGYGRPTLYFAIQGAGVLLERALGIRSRWFGALVLLGPAGLLFHRPFVSAVMIPLLRAIGAIS